MIARRRLPSWLVLALIAASACGREPAPAPEAAAPAAVAPAPPVVTDEGGDFVLRYFSPTTGNLLVAQKPSEVPEAARSQVLVSPTDPTKQGPWLFVADLTVRAGAGYEVTVVDRFELEQKVQAEAAARAPSTPAAGATGGDPAAAGEPQVVLYKTAWCGYCKKAAEYLTLKKVPFVTKDIERDPGARADMMARASKAGVPASQLGGVPVIWIKGRILSGFSREAIDAALGG